MNRPTKSLLRAANRLGVTPSGLSSRVRHLVPGQPELDAALQSAVADKVVLVTGASSGIGEVTARLVGAAGAHVVLVARRGEELERLRDEIVAEGGSASAYPCDLSDFDALDAMVASVLAEHDRVDVLVNNAGLSIRRKVERSDGRFHDFERPMRLNYFAAIRLVLALLPGMRERHSGHIITISSWAVQVRPARFSACTASKAALEAWSDCVQSEVAELGIAFTTIRMPLVRTPMIAPTKAYRRAPALTAQEAGRVVAEAIAYRPRRLRPAIGHALGLAEAISVRSLDRIRRTYG